MGFYAGTNIWRDVIYQLETSDPVVGGTVSWRGDYPTSGFSNAPIQNLADRTTFLKGKVDELLVEVGKGLLSEVEHEDTDSIEIVGDGSRENPLRANIRSALDSIAWTRGNNTYTKNNLFRGLTEVEDPLTSRGAVNKRTLEAGLEAKADKTYVDEELLEAKDHQSLNNRNKPNAHDASAIGFKQEGVGAVNRSVAEKLEEFTSLKDFAIGDGVADDTDAIEAFLSKAEGIVHIPKNSTFVISRSLVINNPSFSGLVGDCPETSRLKFTGSGRLQFVQDIVELPPMVSGFTVSGKSEIHLSETPSVDIESGDVIILWNPDPYSLNPEREYYYDGFMAQVNRVEGEKILTFGKVAKINESTIRLFRMKRRSFVLKDFAFNSGGISNVIRVSHYVGVRVSNLTSLDSGGPLNIKLDKSFDVRVDYSKLTATKNNAYPVQISNCQNFVITGITGNSSRHGIGLGGDGFLASVPPRNGLIQGCTLLNYQPDGVDGVGVGAADAHSNIIDVTYKDCHISSAATLNGRDLKYVDCVIESFTTPDDGNCAFGSAPMEGEITFTRCRFDVSRSVVQNTAGVLRINPFYAQSGEIILKIKDCTVNYINDSTSSTVFPFLRVTKGANKNRMKIIIDGLTSTNANKKYNELVRVDYWTDSDPDAELFIEIKNVDGINYGSYCSGVSAGDSNVKFRIKGWSIRGVFPLSSGETEGNITITIPVRYPRIPTAAVTAVGAPGANNGWILLCRGFSSDQAIIYARALSGENLFTGDMTYQMDSSLIEF